MESGLHVRENSGIVLPYSSVLRCSVRITAGFGGAARNLERITCRKCALQFLIQLKVEFSLFPLCESFFCSHYESSIRFIRVAPLIVPWLEAIVRFKRPA